MASGRSQLAELLRPVVEEAGADLEDVTISPAGRRRMVRVVVDRDGGISLDDIADMTRQVSTALDAHQAMGEASYVLEVTSPGVDRPLTQPRHWQRARGRLVAVVLADGTNLRGRVQEAGPTAAVLDASDGSFTVDYGDVATARVQVEL